ncbi:MAG TPA: hypothetical protein VF136_12180 [Methylomirabilota bacterium]
MPSPRRHLSVIAIALVLLLPASPGGVAAGLQEPPGRVAERAILITLDGARTEEIFGGLDLEVLRSVTKEGPVEETPTYRRYWAPTREERRAKLMPFFWGTWMAADGSIAGDRTLGSRVTLANGHRFSYPGYSEILTGTPRDAIIDSNDQRRNPYPTVLEFLKRALGLERDGVAVFASWETFNWIVEHEEGALTVNAGYESFDHPDPQVRTLSARQFETRTPWDNVRHDMYTFRLAMAHLAAARPRVLHLALGETDDWAHGQRYDRTLQALEQTDAYLEELWRWLQADPDYRDNTAILVTVDHGRGHTPADWHRHGADVAGAEETWLAAVGPAWPRRGAWTDAPEVTTSQVAATLARAMGQAYRAAAPEAGAAVDYLWRE